MSDSGESRRRSVISNVIAGAVVAVVVGAAAIGTPMIVNASNVAQQSQQQAITDAKAATALVRSVGERDALLAQSSDEAGVIAQQEAEAKAAAAAAAQAAAAQAAADAAAAQAAQQVQAAADASSDDSGTSSDSGSSDGGAPASSGLPAGSPVPPIPGTDSPDTTKCASGSASTINGVPTCD
jgi:membrane protein involved in colicin uptake